MTGPSTGPGEWREWGVLRESLLGRGRVLAFPPVIGKTFAIAGQEAWEEYCGEASGEELIALAEELDTMREARLKSKEPDP